MPGVHNGIHQIPKALRLLLLVIPAVSSQYDIFKTDIPLTLRVTQKRIINLWKHHKNPIGLKGLWIT
jgi:hypothetical protein